MRLDSTILYNLVSWQRRGREREREKEWERESACPFGHFPSQTSVRGVQRQPGPSASQALFKRCYHNTFVSPSVSLTHSNSHSSSLTPSLSQCVTINIEGLMWCGSFDHIIVYVCVKLQWWHEYTLWLLIWLPTHTHTHTAHSYPTPFWTWPHVI